MPVRCVVVLPEDDADVLAVLTRSLASQGFDVAHPADGREALEVAAEDQLRVMLLSPSLPVMNGWEVIAALKRNVALKSIPVIVVAAAQPLPEGVVSVPKPLDLGDLVAQVRQAAGEPVELRRRGPRCNDLRVPAPPASCHRQDRSTHRPQR